MQGIQTFCEKERKKEREREKEEGRGEGERGPRGSNEASQVRTGKKHEYIFHLEVFLKVFRPSTRKRLISKSFNNKEIFFLEFYYYSEKKRKR